MENTTDSPRALSASDLFCPGWFVSQRGIPPTVIERVFGSAPEFTEGSTVIPHDIKASPIAWACEGMAFGSAISKNNPTGYPFGPDIIIARFMVTLYPHDLRALSISPAKATASKSLSMTIMEISPLGAVARAFLMWSNCGLEIERRGGCCEILTVCAVIPPDWLTLEMLIGWLGIAVGVGVGAGTDGDGIESWGATSGRACAWRYKAPPRDERTTPAKRNQIEEIL